MDDNDSFTASPSETKSGFNHIPKPEWLRIQLGTGESFREVRRIVKGQGLHTVCEEARCPNMHECWGQHKTATFMILGDTCTRRCRFCAVKTGLPKAADPDEPRRVGLSAATMELSHVVVTMVTRDDMADGGAGLLAQTVAEIRSQSPGSTVELLSSDLMGKPSSIETLMKSQPEIVSHNLETVRRLTKQIRSRSDYDRSLLFLKTCADLASHSVVKSSIMLGLGETVEEIEGAMDDLRLAGVSMMNLGQYLQPSRNHAPVVKYWTPLEFAELKATALAKGFTFVESGPLVRSSYHAGGQYEEFRRRIHPLYQDE